MTTTEEPALFNTNGDPVGRRGRATRDRLLAEVERRCLVEHHRMITVGQVAAAAGTSAATFYHYFPDMPAAVAEVASEHIKTFDSVVELAREVSRGDGDIQACRALVRGYYAYWEQRPGLLETIIIAAPDEDRRIFRVLMRALATFADGLRPAVPHPQAQAIAASLMMMMSHSVARRNGFARDGLPVETLVEGQAWIIHRAVTGREDAASRRSS